MTTRQFVQGSVIFAKAFAQMAREGAVLYLRVCRAMNTNSETCLEPSAKELTEGQLSD